MKPHVQDLRRTSPAALRALVVSIVAAGIPMLRAEDAKAKAADSLEAAPGEFSNSVTVGGGTSFVGGDRAQFQRQLQRPANIYGGIDELHYEAPLNKATQLSIDGHAIYDNRNYGLGIEITNPDVGYVKAGYEEFRTWYDGSGGYSANGNAWIQLYNDGLYLDRRHAFLAAGITLPDIPKVSVRYDYYSRHGLKDSTIWGDYNVAPGAKTAVTKYIVPTFLGIDETRHIVSADVRHTLGNTDFGVGLRYQNDSLDNSRNVARRNGEPKLQRYTTTVDGTSTDYWNANAFTETRFNPQVMLSTGYSYTRTDTDLAGSRIFGPGYGAQYSPNYLNRQDHDEGFYDLSGGSKVDQFVANFNLMLTPWKHVTIVPSVRIEHQDQEGNALFTETAATATNMTSAEVLNTRLRRFTDVTEALALRYTGVTNWAFYARGELLQGQGTLREKEFDVEEEGALSPAQLQRDTESTRNVQKYTVGANWYPHRKVNTAFQYYYRTRQNEYDHRVDDTYFPKSPSNLYPAFIRKHEFDTHDINFRVTLRPVSQVTLVSRYDYQTTSYNMSGGVNATGIALGSVESAKYDAHILSQSASWTPYQQLYFQGSISYALQRTDSPVSGTTGAGAGLVQDAKNDYWNAALTTGFVLSERSDLTTTYTYYRANNYQDNSLVGLPYGAGMEQHGVTTTLTTRIRKDLIWKLQYGYYTSHDASFGGHNDYSAHLVYSSIQYLF